ncbi:hypothetical protein JXL21_15010 [Candidatus Bathyarchaeota archaeon]|nr:hypothetical protein [Candidatus Bathyarchaeota archaeon]
MVEELLDDSKFILLPAALVTQLRLVSGRLGSSVSRYAEEALDQALRVDEMGSNLKEAVDIYRLVTVQRGAGGISVNRANLDELLKKLHGKRGDEVSRLWYESGAWYGAYLQTKFNGENIFDFLEKDLLLNWNLDEVVVKQEDVLVSVRCTSFGMSTTLTELLVQYLGGLMSELGYSENERDVLRGLVLIKFLRKLG